MNLKFLALFVVIVTSTVVVCAHQVNSVKNLVGGKNNKNGGGLQPTHLYRFEDPNHLGKDSVGGYDVQLNPKASYVAPQKGSQPGVVGGYVWSGYGGSIDMKAPTAVTVEFLFRTRDSCYLLGPQGMLSLYVGLSWKLWLPWGKLAFQYDLDGTGANSINYASVGWHHVVVTTHQNSMNVTFCLDGNVCTSAGPQAPTYAQPRFASAGPYINGFALDEVALYDETMDYDTIWMHYQEAIQKHQPYSYQIPSHSAPPPNFPPKIWSNESFAPGAEFPSPSTGTKGVNMTALEQLTEFPDPRFPKNTTILKMFERNFNWMSPSYLGKDDLDVSNAIQKMMYQKYHYNVMANENARTCCAAQTGQIIKNATSWGAEHFDAIIMRLETAGGTQLNNHSLPDACYLQDTDATTNSSNPVFMGHFGQHVPKTQAALRPMSKETAVEVGCPDALFNRDGEMFNVSLTALQQVLQQYNVSSLGRVNNDGEAFVIVFGDVLEKDHACNKSYHESSSSDWLTFWSEWRARLSNSGFRDILMQNLPKQTKFTQYQIQGTTIWFGNWTVTRTIMNKLKNGQYYSCADFYPYNPYQQETTPKIVFKTAGAWHGMDWMHNVRQTEISSGNPLFSPFVAAGWSKQSEYNILPGQWLGLLKLFGVWGAEFYYAGFFSLSAPFPDPANWVWQAALPAYAQAVTMQYHDVFFDGEFAGWIDTGMKNVWCNMRKLKKSPTTTKTQKHEEQRGSSSKTSWKYVIACAIEPYSNWKNSTAEHFENVPIPLHDEEGTVLLVEARIQGSVYVYDPSVSSKLQQLDAWHESTHPWWWGKQRK